MAKPWKDYDVYDVRYRLLDEVPRILEASSERERRRTLHKLYRKYPDREVDFVMRFLEKHLLPAMERSDEEAYEQYLQDWRYWGDERPRLEQEEFASLRRRYFELLEKEWTEGELPDEEIEEQLDIAKDIFLDQHLFADWEPASPPPSLLEERYPPPFDKLLTLDSDRYPALYKRIAAMGDKAVPTLIKIATDEALNRASEESSLVRAPLHALRILTKIGPAEAVEPLMFDQVNPEDEWFHEELPDLFAAIGEPAIEPLAEYLADESQDWYPRAGAAHSLRRIGEENPGLRGHVISVLRKQLVRRDIDPEVNAYIVSALAHLNAEEVLPDIRQAFRQRRVDSLVIGLDTVDMIMGKKPWPWEEKGVPARRDIPKDLGRNDPCWCGSGKKYKHCHWAEDQGHT